MVKCLAQGHKHPIHSQDSNPPPPPAKNVGVYIPHPPGIYTHECDALNPLAMAHSLLFRFVHIGTSGEGSHFLAHKFSIRFLVFSHFWLCATPPYFKTLDPPLFVYSALQIAFIISLSAIRFDSQILDHGSLRCVGGVYAYTAGIGSHAPSSTGVQIQPYCTWNHTFASCNLGWDTKQRIYNYKQASQ